MLKHYKFLRIKKHLEKELENSKEYINEKKEEINELNISKI